MIGAYWEVFENLLTPWTKCDWSIGYPGESVRNRSGVQSVMEWMFASSQNSQVEILTPNVIILGGGGLWRYLGHEGGAMNGSYEWELWMGLGLL